MTKFSRLSPATDADMCDLTREMIAPILADFRRRCAALTIHAPGGVLLDVDMIGPARRTAEATGRKVTPEDIIRWHKKYPEAAQ